MKINIFKDDYFKQFEEQSKKIIKVSEVMKYTSGDQEYDLPNNVISEWFNPTQIKRMPASRSYPHPTQEQMGDEYSLILYQANYLALFLIPKLYENNKDVLIEDVGAGVGHLLAYLSKFGYHNFHVRENFSQMSKHCLDLVMGEFGLSYELNNENIKSTILHNSGVPEPSTFYFSDKSELAICYTNRGIEAWASKHWAEKEFVFLCKDLHDHAFAYCHKNKLEEFKSKLKYYETI